MVLDRDNQDMIMNSVVHGVEVFTREISRLSCTIDEYARPAITMRPRLFPDGNQWCALYGENVQEGLAGFGDTPEMAMLDYDKNFYRYKLTA